MSIGLYTGTMEGSKREKFFDWFREAWWTDLIFGALIIFAGVNWVTPNHHDWDVLGLVTQDKRWEAYASLLSIVTFFAGFTSLSFAAYLGFKGRAMASLNKRAGKRLKTMWAGLIVMTWLSAVAVWVASIIDGRPDATAVWPRWLALAALCIMFVQLLRVMWLLFSLQEVQETEIEPARRTAATPITLARRRRPQAPPEDRDTSKPA